MKAKLIKTGEGYHLKSQIKDIPKEINVYNKINDNEGLFGFGGHTGKLSIKNCEAIERGYDLEDLASYFAYNQSTEESKEDFAKFAFAMGFCEALKILGDKKFSEDDLRLAMHFGKFGETNNQTTTIGFIKSLQQTEWDVEIETNQIPADRAPGGWDISPKLDSDGNLILRRI